jgi:hypothetical protein
MSSLPPLFLGAAFFLLAAAAVHLRSFGADDGNNGSREAAAATAHLHFYIHYEYTSPRPSALRVVSGRRRSMLLPPSPPSSDDGGGGVAVAAQVRRHRGAEQRADGGALGQQRPRERRAGVRRAPVRGRRRVARHAAPRPGGRRAPGQLGHGELPDRRGRQGARVGGPRRHGEVPVRARVHAHKQLRLRPRPRRRRRVRRPLAVAELASIDCHRMATVCVHVLDRHPWAYVVRKLLSVVTVHLLIAVCCNHVRMHLYLS